HPSGGIPMADGKASDLKGCDEEVPLLGVTREFDFGQFIELFDDSPDVNDPTRTPTIARIVIQPNSELASARNAVTGEPPRTKTASSSAMTAAGGSPAGGNGPTPLILRGPNGALPQAAWEPEVHLFDLTEHGPGAKRMPVDIEISDTDTFFRKGTVRVDGHAYKVDLEEASKDALKMGMAVTSFASPTEGKSGNVPVRLS